MKAFILAVAGCKSVLSLTQGHHPRLAAPAGVKFPSPRKVKRCGYAENLAGAVPLVPLTITEDPCASRTAPPPLYFSERVALRRHACFWQGVGVAQLTAALCRGFPKGEPVPAQRD